MAGALAGWAASAEARDLAWPVALTMGTGSAGGTYAGYGEAWGAAVAAATNVHMFYRATEGPNENIMLLDRGAIDLAMTTLGIAHEAWTGGGAWTDGVKFRTIRAVFPMYETAFHGIARAGSGITTADGLAGKRVGVGPESGTGGTYLPRMLRLLGIEVAGFRFGSFIDLVDAVAAGDLDACVLAAGPPVPAFQEIARRTSMRFFGFTAREVALLVRELPQLSATTIPAGTYPGQLTLACPGMFNFAICRQALPDSLIYAVTGAALAAAPTLARRFPVAAETVAGNIGQDRFLPFHPGAARYYRSHGFAVPDRLVME
ncbi:MAG TPA: TAXI family TRAP transporter solute-binding subunit [Acetobacteraceae bacterium]|nr:TAXI family TRAP transporter solute-binding subunit [Acetobacteraceae bacterium]